MTGVGGAGRPFLAALAEALAYFSAAFAIALPCTFSSLRASLRHLRASLRVRRRALRSSLRCSFAPYLSAADNGFAIRRRHFAFHPSYFFSCESTRRSFLRSPFVAALYALYHRRLERYSSSMRWCRTTYQAFGSFRFRAAR